jgi:hypothetical protein
MEVSNKEKHYKSDVLVAHGLLYLKSPYKNRGTDWNGTKQGRLPNADITDHTVTCHSYGAAGFGTICQVLAKFRHHDATIDMSTPLSFYKI